MGDRRSSDSAVSHSLWRSGVVGGLVSRTGMVVTPPRAVHAYCAVGAFPPPSLYQDCGVPIIAQHCYHLAFNNLHNVEMKALLLLVNAL